MASEIIHDEIEDTRNEESNHSSLVVCKARAKAVEGAAAIEGARAAEREADAAAALAAVKEAAALREQCSLLQAEAHTPPSLFPHSFQTIPTPHYHAPPSD